MPRAPVIFDLMPSAIELILEATAPAMDPIPLIKPWMMFFPMPDRLIPDRNDLAAFHPLTMAALT